VISRPLLLLVLLVPWHAHADALVRSQAMKSSTIAEFFIDEERVRVDLEIGLGDIEAFANLLPDDVYARLSKPPLPWAERLARFFRTDLAIRAEDGPPLSGRVLEIGPRQRVERDEISGEPLGEAEEIALFARLEYPLERRPESLTLAGGSGASIGFVAYHEGIPVNDFRYLAGSQTLELDWEDPWYSRFSSRSLRRQYFAPMSGFLYIEPYEVRKEIVVRARDLQAWVDLGLADRDTIPVEIQAELKRRAAAFLREHQPVTIDERSPEPELARINFLERSLRTSRVIDPPEELDANSAILGVIFVYPLLEPLPQRVHMDWDLWSDRIQQIPAAAVDQAGPLPTLLEPDFRVLEWQNFLRFPELPTLQELAPPPGRLSRILRGLRWPLLLIGFALLLRWRRAAALTLIATGAAFWLSRSAVVSQDGAAEIVSGLLDNVYRAFDFREEEQIYDVLSRSVDGELLTRTYLETRRGLELTNQGGARAKVKTIEVVALEAEPAEAGSFRARATWNVAGSVGHWGHVHERANRYRADLRVAPVDGEWKLVELEILEEERI
jgi:hypothetical protein